MVIYYGIINYIDIQLSFFDDHTYNDTTIHNRYCYFMYIIILLCNPCNKNIVGKLKDKILDK